MINLKKKLVSKKACLNAKIIKGKEVIEKVWPKVFSIAFVLTTSATRVFADVSGDGTTEWNTVINLLVTWLGRGAAAYLLYGVFVTAKAYKTHNPDAKDDGIDNIVTACLAIAGIAVVKGFALS